MAKVQSLFEEMDNDGDHAISQDEFVSCLVTRRGFTEADAVELYEEIMAVGPGAITEAKFGQYVNVKTIEEVNRHFKLLDIDKNRNVSQKEFYAYCKQIGIPQRKGKHLWEELDADGDGKLKYKEFADWAGGLMAGEMLRGKFREGAHEAQSH